MKILHITDSLSSGGKERQLVEVLKFFSKTDNINCELVIMSEDVHYSYIDKLNIKTYKIIRTWKKELSVFLKLYKIFKESKPDVIHSWNSMCSIYALPAAKLIGIKFVDGCLRDAPSKSNFKKEGWLRSKLTFPFSDIIVANSYAGLRSYNAPPNKSLCVHNGFDFERLKSLDTKDAIKRRFNISTDHVIGMVASFSPKKDYVSFIKAAHMILDKRKDVTFVAVGDGVDLGKIKSMIKSEYTDFIKLIGKQKKILSIVNIFDIGILATYTEGISNSVMEYMALKKPVITTDCGGNRELIINNYNGFLVDYQNPKQIEEKICLLLENIKLAENLGQNGFNRLKKDFNLEIMGNNLLRAYLSLL